MNQVSQNYDFPQVPKPSNNSSKFRWLLLCLLLIALSFKLGYNSGKKGFVFEPKEFKVVNQNNFPKEVNYQLLWDAIKTVNQKYIETSPTPDKILYGAVKGAIAAYGDPYTVFLEPQNLQTFRSDLAGSFGGIGAEIGKRDGGITIISPLDDSPAMKAGLLAKDIILQVDGQSTMEWSVEEAVNKIRGKKGTSVLLTIFRESKKQPFDVTIIRDTIEIKSVKLEYKEVEKEGKKQTFAIIRLTRFGDDTKNLFDQAINEIFSKNISGLILDLRNNPGGYLQTSVEIASNWVENEKLIVKEERSQGNSVEYKAEGNQRLKNIKTVVLINGGSASAAEILAGALLDYKLAKVIGEKSFGKGSVQELIDLSNGSAVKVTVAKWVTPGGKNLNKEGLHPDIEVKITEEDFTSGKDPQMDRALEEIIK